MEIIIDMQKTVEISYRYGYQDKVIWLDYFIIVAEDTIAIQEVGSPERELVMVADALCPRCHLPMK